MALKRQIKDKNKEVHYSTHTKIYNPVLIGHVVKNVIQIILGEDYYLQFRLNKFVLIRTLREKWCCTL